jgi:hypothetical protein
MNWAQAKEDQGRNALRTNQFKSAASAFDGAKVFYKKAAETAK